MRAWGRPYWTAWTSTLLFFAGFYTLLVPLPRYLANIGLSDWQIGLVLGAFGVVSLFWRTVAGIGVDRWGTRPMLLLGAALLILGAAGVVTTTDLLLLLLLRILQTAGYVAFTTAGTALVIELTPDAERSRRLAVFGAAANVAITSAPALGTAVLEILPLEAGFFIASGLALLAGGLASTIVPPRRGTRETSGWRTRWQFPRVLWLPMLAAALYGAGFAAFFLYAPIFGDRRGASPGLLYTMYGVGIIATRLVGSRWLDRTAIGRSLLASTVLMAGGLILVGIATSAVLLGLGALLIAAGGGIFHPVLIAQHSRILPEAPGQASAGFYLGFDIGIGLGGWIYGAVLEWFGPGAICGAAVLLLLLTLPLLPGLSRQPLPAAQRG